MLENRENGLRRVINGIQNSEIKNLFNPENIFLSDHGGGAGNNWASGFDQANKVQEELLDMIGQKSPAPYWKSLPVHYSRVSASGHYPPLLSLVYTKLQHVGIMPFASGPNFLITCF